MGSFAAQETKALDGGTLPVPMIWIDGGGQLPYTHVVVDVSGSMSYPTFVPNYSGPQQFSRAEYVMFLLLDMYQKGAIKGDTRIYPMTPANPNWDSFISANFLFGWGLTPYARSTSFGPEVWPILFRPRAASTTLGYMSKLPHTKTLLITDAPRQLLDPKVSPGATNGWRGDIIAW